MSLLKPTKNADFFSKQYFERALQECPKLASNSGEPIKDHMMTVVAFNLAYNAFYRDQRSVGVKLLRSVFISPGLSERVHRAAALLEIQMCVEMNRQKVAQSLLEKLSSNECWTGASERQLECFELLSSRVKSREVSGLEERNGDASFTPQFQFKAGEARTVLNLLLRRRKISSHDERRLLDNAIGCIYALAFKDCNMAESYFRSSMLKKLVANGSMWTPIVPSALFYHTALAQLGSGKPRAAFWMFTSVWPVFQENPRIWLRITECCMQNLGISNPSVCQLEIENKLRSMANASWDLVRLNGSTLMCNQNAAHSSTSFGCNIGFAAYVVHQGIAIALSRKEDYAYLLPYLYSLNASINVQLHRFEESLMASGNLLNLPQINTRQRLMAVFYKAESLAHLNRLPEALTCLEQAVPIQSIPHTHSRLLYNKALIEVLDKRYERAFELVREISTNNFVQRPENLHLQLYLEMENRRRMARHMFKSRAEN